MKDSIVHCQTEWEHRNKVSWLFFNLAILQTHSFNLIGQELLKDQHLHNLSV